MSTQVQGALPEGGIVPYRHRVRSGLAVLLALTLGGPAFLSAQQKPPQESAILGLERIYTRPGLIAPALSGIEWSPDGKLLSYVRRGSSSENLRAGLYVIDASNPSLPGKLLVDSAKLGELLPASRQSGNLTQSQATGLGRIAADQYRWAPDGRAILFISPDNLYWFDPQAQAGRRLLQPLNSPAGKKEKASDSSLSQIKDVRISPDGRLVSFVRSHDLWMVDVATARETQLTFGGSEELLNAELDWVYPEELAIREAYWWAPDSSRIAFLRMDERPVTKYPLVNSLSYTGETHWMRYPKAGDSNPIVRVGVIELPGAKAKEKAVQNSQGKSQPPPVRWMDTGSDTNIYLPRVNWLRDSSTVAIQRLNRAQNKLDLLFADASTGQSRTVLSEDDKYWINLSDDLYFLADGKRFLWSSESDHLKGAQFPNPKGLRYLYLYDISGKLMKQLTHDDTQVAHVSAVDEKQNAAFFVGSATDVRERQLYRVSLESGVADQITRQPGSHSVRISPAFDQFVDSFSTTAAPPKQLLTQLHPRGWGGDERSPVALSDGSTPQLAAANLRPVEFLTVAASDGTTLQAMMIKPPNFDPAKKYPVIVSLYGGPHAQVVVNAWGGPTFLFNELLAENGYIIFTLDNRGSGGRGHAFETPLYHHFGGIELADQLAGVSWLKSQPFVDPDRIGIRGWSYGGFMTCVAMFRAADVFKTAFAGSPVTDWRQYDSIYTERYMGLPQENQEGYKDSSPVNFAGQLKGKLLIAAGTGDDNVHFANTVELAENLINAGRYAEIQLYPGRGHGIADQPAQLHLFRHVLEFFLKNL